MNEGEIPYGKFLKLSCTFMNTNPLGGKSKHKL